MEPLKGDGRVDYLAALNAIGAQGVTPENNAAVPLMQILGYLDCDAQDPAGGSSQSKARAERCA